MKAAGRSCPDEGVLVALLDGELPAAAETGVRAHLDGCAPCRDRFEALARRSEAVRRWIGRHDAEAPGREAYDLGGRGRVGAGWRRGWVAAAAIVLIAAGVAVGPARGLLPDGVRHWVDALPVLGTAREAAPPRAGPPSGPAPGTAFAGAAELTLVFESPATAGEIRIEPAADSLVTLWTPPGDVELTVRPGRVDVGNGAAPRGDYRLAVPSGLSRLRLRVAGGADSLIDVDDLTRTRAVRLPRGSPRGGGPP